MEILPVPYRVEELAALVAADLIPFVVNVKRRILRMATTSAFNLMSHDRFSFPERITGLPDRWMGLLLPFWVDLPVDHFFGTPCRVMISFPADRHAAIRADDRAASCRSGVASLPPL